MVTLVTGKTVSSISEEWRLECEARHLLKMPLEQRREALSVREVKRGKEAIDKLRKAMIEVHEASRKQ